MLTLSDSRPHEEDGGLVKEPKISSETNNTVGRCVFSLKDEPMKCQENINFGCKSSWLIWRVSYNLGMHVMHVAYFKTTMINNTCNVWHFAHSKADSMHFT